MVGDSYSDGRRGQTGESSAVVGFRPGCAVASASNSASWISEDERGLAFHHLRLHASARILKG